MNLHDDACECPQCNPADIPDEGRHAGWTDGYILDEQGQMWMRCGPACDLEPKPGGGTRCRCHE